MDKDVQMIAQHLGLGFGYLLKVLDEIQWRLDHPSMSDGDLSVYLDELKEHLGQQLGNSVNKDT